MIRSHLAAGEGCCGPNAGQMKTRNYEFLVILVVDCAEDNESCGKVVVEMIPFLKRSTNTGDSYITYPLALATRRSPLM